MARSFHPAAIAAALCLLFVIPSSAIAQNTSARLSPANQYLFSMLPMDITLQRYLDHLRNQFRQADADMNGELNQADIDVHASVAAAGTRMMLSTMILRADLDGDGTVTADELRRVMRYDRRMHPRPPATDPNAQDPVEVEVRKLMQADADGDGRITHAEATNFAKTQPDYMRSLTGLADPWRRMLAVTPAGKPSLALADLEIAAEALFRTIDSNGDGKVSIEEHKAYRDHPDQPHVQAHREAQLARAQREQEAREAARARAEKEAEKRAVCAMPKASEAAKVVLLSAYQTQAISSVTLGSQDIAVGIGNITVEAGSEPIYLVISTFRPTIWRFYGAVERIERLVLTGTMSASRGGGPEAKPAVGATGIAAERVTFLGQPQCMRDFSETPSREASVAAAHVKREAGKDVAVIAARYSISDVAVPSGRITQTPDENQGKLVIVKRSGSLKIEGDPNNVIIHTGRSNLESDMRRFSPGGVVELDPRRVVASLPVERYQVLPQQAGLLQLVHSGALAQNRNGEFLIKEKIRFPAELTGAHSVQFLLLRGVPLPDGDPGHSDVISEETGEKLKFDKQR